MLAGYGFDSFLWAELLRSGKWNKLSQECLAGLRAGPQLFARRFLRMLGPELAARWQNRATLMSPFFQADFVNHWHDLIAPGGLHKETGSHLRRALKYDMHVRLPALLRYEDRNSMAFSLESRVPFLDHRLVSFVFALPDTALIHQGWSKWILRQSMQNILPAKIQWRRDKMGFVTPQQNWLKEDLQELIKDVMMSQDFKGRPFWHSSEVLQAYQDALLSKDSRIMAWLWRILSLELWLQYVVKP